MRVERQLLTDLLRSRGNDETAELAARSLPPTIDLARDRFLLRQCGIDPNAVAMDLGLSDPNESAPRPTEPTDGPWRPRDVSLAAPGSRERSSVDTHPAPCPRCARRFSSADAMLDHLSSHLRGAKQNLQSTTGPSIVLSAMPAWQVDAALADLERSLRKPRLPRLARAWLKRAGRARQPDG